MRIAFTTLGCKINQYESEQLRQNLLSQGNTIVPFDGEADVYIINTCSVTAKSDYQCRQVIRSAARRGRDAKIVVTGCYASTRPEELKQLAGVTFVVGNAEKGAIPSLILNPPPPSEGSALSSSTPTRGSRTRGFLKIQDGCDNRCSYCIVPLARGASRSVDQAVVLREFKRLVLEGCPEIVLTGIHIGTYGADLASPASLTALLHELIPHRGSARIRLSSIEPHEITSETIALLGKTLCRHLHIPLQSGDETILRTMRRNYTPEFYLELLRKIADQVPGVALGADIMVGFPGEGEKEFAHTLELVQKSPLTHLHVFSYSPRPGTPAAAMKDQVPEPVKKERSEALRDLGRGKNLSFRQKNIGLVLKTVVESKRDTKTGMLTGLTDNYLRVLISGADNEAVGKELSVGIQRIEENDIFAEVI